MRAPHPLSCEFWQTLHHAAVVFTAEGCEDVSEVPYAKADAHSNSVDERRERYVPRTVQEIIRHKVIGTVLKIEANHGFTVTARLAHFQRDDRGIVH